MPSIAAHMAVAKLISDKLYIDKEEFYKGNILPDIIDIPDSHHKMQFPNRKLCLWLNSP